MENKIIFCFFIFITTNTFSQQTTLSINYGDTIIEHEIATALDFGQTNESKKLYYFKNDNAQVAIEENYYLGKLSGKRIEYYPNGLIYRIAIYQNGLKNGDESVYDEFGNLTHKYQNKNGHHHGFYKNLKENYQGRYKFGQPHGKWEYRLKTTDYYVVYFNMGDTSERTMKNLKTLIAKGSSTKMLSTDAEELDYYNMHDTILISKDKNFEIEKVYYLPKDSLHHPTKRKAIFCDNPKITAREFYIYKASINGVFYSYYKDGTLHFKKEFKLGKMHGDFKVYDFHGNLKLSGKYKHGKKVGKWVFYLPDGKVLRTERY